MNTANALYKTLTTDSRIPVNSHRDDRRYNNNPRHHVRFHRFRTNRIQSPHFECIQFDCDTLSRIQCSASTYFVLSNCFFFVLNFFFLSQRWSTKVVLRESFILLYVFVSLDKCGKKRKKRLILSDDVNEVYQFAIWLY